VQNLKLPLPVFTLSQCCSPKQTLLSSLSFLLTAQSRDLPLDFSALTNVEELELEYRRSTRYNHLGAELDGIKYRRAAKESAALEAMIDSPSRTRPAVSNMEHGATIGEFLINNQLT
jgi:hypothetical protein